jgi:hypothetical protein
MTKEQFAGLLNRRQYSKEITKDECQLAKKNGLLVAFGHSDDCLELRGILHDEYYSYDGSIEHFGINQNNQLVHISDETVASLKEWGVKTFSIQAIWCPTSIDSSWLITTDDLPFATFDIFEDDNLFCRGIVIDKQDIINTLKD